MTRYVPRDKKKQVGNTVLMYLYMCINCINMYNTATLS